MKHFEEEYRGYVKDSTPDLWDRIEKALPERQEGETEPEREKEASHRVISHKMVWRMASAAAGICVILTAAAVMNLQKKSAESSKADSIEMAYEEDIAPETISIEEEAASASSEPEMVSINDADDFLGEAVAASAEPDMLSINEADDFFEEAASAPVDPEMVINSIDYDLPLPAEGELISVTTETMDCPWDPEKELMLVALRGQAGRDISALLHVDFASLDGQGFRCISLDDPDGGDIQADLSNGGTYAALYEIGYPGEEDDSLFEEEKTQGNSEAVKTYTIEQPAAEKGTAKSGIPVRVSVDVSAVLTDSHTGGKTDNIAKAAEAAASLIY